MPLILLHPGRFAKVKTGYITRRVSVSDLHAIDTDFGQPEAGDLVLARVDAIGHHNGLQLQNGRRAELHGGDEIIVAFGRRYVPDQLEADIGFEDGQCHLVADGGLAGRVLSRDARLAPPTTLTPIGLVVDYAGQAVNLRDYALAPANGFSRIPVMAVLGSSMNIGKTAAATSLVRGLTLAGLRVGGARITGAGGDPWPFVDAGAQRVLDFTDAGHGSTYRIGDAEIQRIMQTILSHLAHAGSDVIVMEVADSIFERETAELMRSADFREIVDGVVIAAGDAVSAVRSAKTVAKAGLPVVGVSGVITCSPLACREFEDAVRMPVLTKQFLSDPTFATGLVWPLDPPRSA